MRTTPGIALLGLALVLTACSSTAATPGPSSVGPATSASAPASRAPAASPPATLGIGSPETPSSPAPEVASMSPEPFTLTSTSFENGGAIPRRFTCDGEDVSPDLAWSGAPDGTVALVLVVTDPDAQDFVHWLVYDMTGTPSGGLPRGVSSSPDAPPQGSNSFGKRGYGGPCPPSGTHHYRFTLSALDAVLELTGTPKLESLRAAMAGHVLAEATLTGTYRRG